jgi:hypothetical protein
MGTTTEQLITQATQYPDYILVVAVFVAIAFYGFIRGTKALSELSLSLPLAAFVYTLIPYNLSWGAPAVFAALVVAAMWVLARYTSGLDDNTDWHKIALSAAGATGLLLVISATIVDFTSLYSFGNPIVEILKDSKYVFYITVGSLVAVAFSRKV